MKLPKTFVPEKDLEKVTKELLSHDLRINRLLVSCEDFLDKSIGTSPAVKYAVGEEFASSIVYDKEDVEELSKRIKLQEGSDVSIEKYLGFYLSALINKVITDQDEIVLALGFELAGIGFYLPRGIVIVKDSVGDWTGGCMTGGKLEIGGNAKDYTGSFMKKGLIIVEGDVGILTGYMAEEGEIFVNGGIESVPQSCRATVYEMDEKIWPRN